MVAADPKKWALHDTEGRIVPSDEKLMERYLQLRDASAYEDLVHRHERELYSYLCRYLGDAELAKDAFQGTFLQVHLKCDQFDSTRRFRPWLYALATNQAIDLQRREKRHRLTHFDTDYRSRNGAENITSLIDAIPGKEVGPTASLDEEDRRQWVGQAVAALPEGLRAAVTLVYYQGLKYREAAEVMSIPLGTVKSRLHTALVKLNQAWFAKLKCKSPGKIRIVTNSISN
jgi:RNA polymerase sigma-70 factor (ECF subfamily)